MSSLSLPRIEIGGTLRARLIWLGLSLLFVTLPFLLARFVPSAELPQHALQVRLLRELWGLAPATVDLTQYETRPLAPNTLVYWPMFLLSSVATPGAAAKLTALLVVWWVAFGLSWVAYARGRSALSALLAVTLVFSSPFYAGLLGFVAGFVVWLLLAERIFRPWPDQARALDLAAVSLLALLLVWCHVLWLFALLLCVVVEALHFRSPRALAYRTLALLPAVALTVVAYPELLHTFALPTLDAGMPTQTFPDQSAFSRLVVLWFGGVQGWAEAAATIVLVLYVPASLLGVYGPRGFDIDTRLLSVGLLLSAFALFGPERFMNTPDGSIRFAPFGMMVFLLALPPLRSALAALFFLGCATLFALTLTLAWFLYNREDLTGLKTALTAQRGPRTLVEVDDRKVATVLRGRPFPHMFAYFHARSGGEAHFSLADAGWALVARKQPDPLSYRRAVLAAGTSDAKAMNAADCVLVNGTTLQHKAFQQRTQRVSEATSGLFRLYCREPPVIP